MRFRQLVEDTYVDDLKNAIVSILTAISAEGIREFDTTQLIQDLQDNGYSIDDHNIFDVLNNLPIVASADAKTIRLNVGSAQAGNPDVEKSQTSALDKMAQKQAKKDLGL